MLEDKQPPHPEALSAYSIARHQNESLTTYTTAQLCDVLQVSVTSLPALLKAGAIPAPIIDSGRIRRWSAADVRRFLAGGAAVSEAK
ncbi:MAG: helix-turn-helix transcriptional regulator [Macromonas sp.]